MDRVYDPETLSALADLVRSLAREKGRCHGAFPGRRAGGRPCVTASGLFSRAVFLSAWVCASDRSIQDLHAHRALVQCQSAPEIPAALAGEVLGIHAGAGCLHGRLCQPDHPENGMSPGSAVGSGWMRLPGIRFPADARGLRRQGDRRDEALALGARPAQLELPRTLVLDGMNHDFPLRAPERFNPILRSFLEDE